MRHITILIIYILAPTQSWCQYFYKIYPEERTATFVNIKEESGRVFISTATLCPNWECSQISEFDSNGNRIWIKSLPNTDVGTATLGIDNSTLLVGGNYFPGVGKSVINRLTLDGSFIDEHIYEDPQKRFEYTIINSLSVTNNRILITGQGITDKSKALIYGISKDMKLSNIFVDTSLESSVVWDAFIGPDSLLTCFIDQSNKFFPHDIRRIEKYDKDLNLVWKYIPDTMLSNRIKLYGTVLENGNIFYTYFTWGYPTGLPNFRCMDTVSKKTLWQYDFPRISSHARLVLRTKQLKNGDILISGVYTTKATEPRIGDSPWLMRIDQNGNRKWERAYVEIAPDGEDKTGVLWDAIELDNGDLMAVGFVRNDGKWDPLIIRTDADGCIDQGTPTCPTVQIIDLMTGAVDVIGDSKIEVYPNPASTYITIKGGSLIYPVQYSITSYTGQVVSSGFTNDSEIIDVDYLPVGIYLLQIIDQNGNNKMIKWVKL